MEGVHMQELYVCSMAGQDLETFETEAWYCQGERCEDIRGDSTEVSGGCEQSGRFRWPNGSTRRDPTVTGVHGRIQMPNMSSDTADKGRH
jgi:hypothetical protein